MIKSQCEAVDKLVLKTVGSHENLDQSIKYLNNENHVSEVENDEVNDSIKPNNLTNVYL